MRKPQQVRFHSWNKHKPAISVRKKPISPAAQKATSPARSPAQKKTRVNDNQDDSLHDTLEVEADESEFVLDPFSNKATI
jgi:hypothetical protein